LNLINDNEECLLTTEKYEWNVTCKNNQEEDSEHVGFPVRAAVILLPNSIFIVNVVKNVRVDNLDLLAEEQHSTYA